MNKKLDVLKRDVRAASDSVSALSSVTATGYSKAIPVAQYAAVKVNVLASSVTSGGVLKVWVSDEYEAPDFTSAIAVDNWYQQQSVIDTGSTDITPITDITIDANGSKSYELNTNGAKWVCIELDSRTDGTFSVKTIGYNL
ncbi:MAG: hypothetical protein KDH96_08145 [Candidatus Riesia sp.]|nr:hypothetical protein [Candidatus Riesia sp.]